MLVYISLLRIDVLSEIVLKLLVKLSSFRTMDYLAENIEQHERSQTFGGSRQRTALPCICCVMLCTVYSHFASCVSVCQYDCKQPTPSAGADDLQLSKRLKNNLNFMLHDSFEISATNECRPRSFKTIFNAPNIAIVSLELPKMGHLNFLEYAYCSFQVKWFKVSLVIITSVLALYKKPTIRWD